MVPPAKSPGAPATSALWRFGPLLAALAGMAVYLPTVGYEFVYDDALIVRENPRIRELGSPDRYLATSYWDQPGQNKEYRPLVMLSYAVNWAVAGDNPVTYRAFNLLLHGCVIALIGILAGAMFGSPRLAALVAGLFALHPIHTEVVAGVVGRAELMASAGFVAGLLCAWRSMNADGRARWLWACGAGACAAVAAGSKENGLTLIPAMALLPLAARNGGQPASMRLAAAIRGIAPALALAALAGVVYLVIRASVLGGLSGPRGVQQVFPYDNPLVELTGAARTLSALKMLGRYALMLVWPFHQSPDYSYGAIPLVARLGDPTWLLGAILCPLFLAGLWFLRRRPASLLGILFFFTTFILTSNLFFPIGVMLAERLLYLPSFGFCLVAADAGVWAWDRAGAAGRRVVTGIAAICALAFTAQTLQYERYWKNNKLLFTHMAERVPGSARANVNYSLVLVEEKRYAEAETHLRRALEIYPGQPMAMVKLGEIYYETRREKEALDQLESAFKADPGSADAVKYLSRLYYEMNRAADAEAIFKRALEFNPKNNIVRGDYGRYLESLGRHREAVDQLEQYLRGPGAKNDKWVYESLARSHRALGNTARAAELEALAAPLPPPDAKKSAR